MPVHYVMIGGFLGAGKTTAMLQCARRLTDLGRRVGLITNDQGSDLVDTRLLRGQGFRVEEIAGGCFCCRFTSLVEAARRLAEVEPPDILLAEPVGSCTDLVATVALPLRRLHGDWFSIAPVSVLVDPFRARRILGLDPGPRFSDRVRYIYRKQLEEADVIVINKADRLEAAHREGLQGALTRQFPHARQFVISAREGTGLESWSDHVLSADQQPRALMDVDYGAYAEGEARLGWLNAGFAITGTGPWDGNALLRELGASLRASCAQAGIEVAHLKMTLESTGSFPDIGVLNLVQNDTEPELAFVLHEPLIHGQLTLNLRAEAAPALMETTVRAAVHQSVSSLSDAKADENHLQAFQPARPEPTHRAE